MPRSLVSSAYSNADIWVQEQLSAGDTALILRPETTPSTYAYMQHSLGNHSKTRLERVGRMIASLIPLPTRIVPSDRLPAYSEVTMDVEIDNGDKWMEVSSISRRTDFPQRYGSQLKRGPAIDHDVLVLEIAIGLDRCVYNWGIAADR
ncbi:glycyl-tRNA synthetase [Rhizobium leguminosarum]|nr:glycyl-tRNA synthetase [Rhizobium leguminosarum]